MAGIKIVMAMDGNWMLHNKIHFDGSQGRLPLNLSYSIQNSKSVSRRKFRVKQQKGKQTAAETIEYEETVLDYKASGGIKLMALVAVRNTNDKAFANNFLSIFKPQNHSKGGIVLQLVSTELDPRSMEPKLGKETVLNLTKDHKLGDDGRISTYKVQFLVDPDFGVPGAVTVVNSYDREFFLESINIVQDNTVHFTCKSWVQSNKLDPDKRRFFISKAYLPCETPNGVKELREKELRQLRGDGIGKGRRLSYNRIYDYEVYNDLGDPDKGEEYARPTLGGQHNPHPTRCRTGRPSTKSDPKLESQASESEPIYVPRDEEYEDIKLKNIDQGKLMGVLRNVVPALKDSIMGSEVISNIDYYIKEPPKKSQLGQGAILAPLLSRILLNFRGAIGEFLKFDAPKTFSREKSHLLLDDEFGRQVLAGLNPMSIERLKVFPPVSKLDSSIYGSVESALKEEHIIGQIEGMSIQQALEENKLFILDYHDIYLPFLDRINALDERKAYATTTIFFLTKMGTLKPIAIQLALPKKDPNTASKQVLTPPPPVDDTSKWLWQLGKAHVCANDAAVHTLVHH